MEQEQLEANNEAAPELTLEQAFAQHANDGNSEAATAPTGNVEAEQETTQAQTETPSAEDAAPQTEPQQALPYEELQKRWERERGRTAALNKHNSELREINERFVAEKANAPALEGLSTEDLADLKELSPAAAEMLIALQATVKQQSALLDSIGRTSEAQSSTQLNEQQKREIETGVQVVGEILGDKNWMASIETPEFKAWFDVQPQAIKNIVDHGDVNDTVYLIKSFRAASQPTNEITRQALKVQESRERVQKQAVSPRTAAPEPRKDNPQDFDSLEAAFNYHAKKG